MLGASHISQVVSFLKGEGELEKRTINIEEIRSAQAASGQPDFLEIQGQELLRRAAEVAVAGMHNLLMIGSARFRQDDDSQAYSHNFAGTVLGRITGDL